MSGEGQSFLLPVSGLDQIQNIDKWSNTDVPGLWIFKVGPLAPLENIIEPEPSDFQSKNLFQYFAKTWIFLQLQIPEQLLHARKAKQFVTLKQFAQITSLDSAASVKEDGMEMERIAWQNNYLKELMEGKITFKTRMKL